MEIAHETDYSKVNALKPNYQLFKLTQESGGTTVTLSAAGGEQAVFDIPANVVNLSRSYLAFTVTAAAQATDYVALIMGGTVAAIRDIELVTQSGERLVNIPNVTKYLQNVSLTDNKHSSLMTSSDESTFSRVNIIAGDNPRSYKMSAAIGGDPALANARQNVLEEYVEPVQYITSGADATALSQSFRVPMSIFKNSLLELDKDLWFGQILSLRITFNPHTVIGMDGNGNSLAGQDSLAAIPTFTGFNLYLAVEKNPVLAQQIKEQVVTKGLDVLCDYVHSYNRNLTGTAHTLSYRFSRAHGRSLKKIYAVPYIASNTAGTNFYNHVYDQDAEAIVDVYTQLNNERLQQWNMDTSEGDEYMVMKQKLSGSCILSLTHFQYNYFFADSWTDLKFWEREPNQKLGLPLDIEQKWDLVATTEGARNWYIFAVCQRTLSISADGIVFK